MKHELVYRTLLCLLHLPALLPLQILYVVSDGIYLLVYHIFRYRVSTVRQNLKRSFPEKDTDELRNIERKFFHHLCDCIVETIKLLHISDEEINRRMEVTNGELIEQTAQDGRSFILFLGHYGNWEWAQAITLHYAHPTISGEIYRPLHNKVMDRIMQKVRSRFDTVCIPQQQAVRTLLRMNQNKEQFIIGFIADQRPNSSNLNHWTTFLHQDTAYSAGGESIGQRINAHYVYLHVEKQRRGYYRMSFQMIEPQIFDVPYPYTLRFLHMLEETIQHSPEYWLWSHKRWRFPKQDNINNNLKEITV